MPGPNGSGEGFRAIAERNLNGTGSLRSMKRQGATTTAAAIAIAALIGGCGGASSGSESSSGDQASPAQATSQDQAQTATQKTPTVSGKAAAKEINTVIHKVAICKAFDGPHTDLAGSLYITCSDTDDANAGNKYVDVRVRGPVTDNDTGYDPDVVTIDSPESAAVPWQMNISYATLAEAKAAAKATGGHIIESGS